MSRGPPEQARARGEEEGCKGSRGRRDAHASAGCALVGQLGARQAAGRTEKHLGHGEIPFAERGCVIRQRAFWRWSPIGRGGGGDAGAGRERGRHPPPVGIGLAKRGEKRGVARSAVSPSGVCTEKFGAICALFSSALKWETVLSQSLGRAWRRRERAGVRDWQRDAAAATPTRRGRRPRHRRAFPHRPARPAVSPLPPPSLCSHHPLFPSPHTSPSPTLAHTPSHTPSVSASLSVSSPPS